MTGPEARDGCYTVRTPCWCVSEPRAAAAWLVKLYCMGGSGRGAALARQGQGSPGGAKARAGASDCPATSCSTARSSGRRGGAGRATTPTCRARPGRGSWRGGAGPLLDVLPPPRPQMDCVEFGIWVKSISSVLGEDPYRKVAILYIIDVINHQTSLPPPPPGPGEPSPARRSPATLTSQAANNTAGWCVVAASLSPLPPARLDWSDVTHNTLLEHSCWPRPSPLPRRDLT